MVREMSSGALLSLTLLAAGLALLLGWLALTLDNPRLPILLRKCVVFFILPGSLMVVIPGVVPMSMLGGFPIGALLLASVLAEEFLKVSAARSEHRPLDKFALVMLFGILELLLVKPIGPFFAGAMLGEWSRWGLIGITMGGLLAVLMHSVTAALYAFRFAERPLLGFITCFAIHATYNFVVLIFVNIWVGGVLAIILGTALALLWPEPAAGSLKHRSS